MSKRKLRTIWRGGIAGTLAVVLSCGGILPSKESKAAEVYGSIEVDPYAKYQTLEGWGTSLCWWGNIIGSWGDKDYNQNGIPDREEIAKLAFSPEYLNLNIARYNVGGGDAPGHWDPTSGDYHLYRCEGRVPGWTKDMGYKEDGSGTFAEDAFYKKKTEEMADAGQLWMLEQANAYRLSQKDIVNEVFSNSPPYYMTKSNCSSGNVRSKDDNLKEECYDDFAKYMARATKWIANDLAKKYGSKVSYVEPMNEPDSDYWGAYSSKQEGCHFSAGGLQSTMLLEQKKALKELGLDEVRLTATDETSLGSAINSFGKLSNDAKGEVATISAHTYSGSDAERTRLRDIARSYDKGLWMSEVCRGGGKHTSSSHDSMTQTHSGDLSEGILKDLKIMQSSAWIEWLVADSEYECIQTNSNWGLLHTVFEANGPEPKYHKNLFNWDGSVKSDVPKAGSWYMTKQFYTLMQYSKFLKAGYTMIEVGDDNMIGAVSPDGKEVVIVAQNTTDSSRQISLDMSEFGGIGKVDVYRTSERSTGKVQNPTTGDKTECCSKITSLTLTNACLNTELPENSITTFVVSGNQPMFDLNTSTRVVNDQVYSEDGNGNTVSGNKSDKFTYKGNGWSLKDERSAYGEGVYESSTPRSSATFTFTGSRAMLLGNKQQNGAGYTVAVDGVNVTGSYSAKADSYLTNQILYDTGKLKEGTHTVTLIKDSASNTILSVDCAKIITGSLGTLKAPTINKIQAYDQALKVTFCTVTEAKSYRVRYGTDQKLNQEMTVTSSPAVITGLKNGQVYYVQVVAEGMDGTESSSMVYSQTPQAASKTMLYNVDIAQKNVEAPVDGTLGRYNSVLDQRFGKDTVTGRRWGYVESTSGGTWDDTDPWWSVRYSSKKDVGSDMDYQFELEQGEYWVTVGSFDPWGNGTGRKQVVTCNGQSVTESFAPLQKENTHQFKAKVTDSENGILTIGARVAEGGNDNSILSFIQIESYDGEAIASIEQVEAAALEGSSISSLPKKVSVTKRNGAKAEGIVEWKLPEAFHAEKPFGTVGVSGKVAGTDLSAAASVQVVPKDLEYFIDCGLSEVKTQTYKNAMELTEGMLNRVSDQRKTSNTTWGYTGTIGGDIEKYGGVDTHDPYESGWWARGGKDISYQVTLQPGKHKVSMGFTGWWNMNRNMKVTYRVGNGTYEKNLFSVTVPKNDTIAPSGEIEVAGSKSQVVTVTVKKADKDDPILSWIGISGQKNKAVVQSKPVLKPQVISAKKAITTDLKAKSFSLKAKSSGDGKLTYSVDNKKVATVESNGKVHVRGVGKAVITITAAQTKKYKKATMKVAVTVNPVGTTITKMKNLSHKRMVVKWKKNKSVTGYVLQYGVKGSKKAHQSYRIKNKTTGTKTLSHLARGKKYEVRIRTYQQVGKKKYYSAWSKAKTHKIW